MGDEGVCGIHCQDVLEDGKHVVFFRCGWQWQVHSIVACIGRDFAARSVVHPVLRDHVAGGDREYNAFLLDASNGLGAVVNEVPKFQCLLDGGINDGISRRRVARRRRQDVEIIGVSVAPVTVRGALSGSAPRSVAEVLHHWCMDCREAATFLVVHRHEN